MRARSSPVSGGRKSATPIEAPRQGEGWLYLDWKAPTDALPANAAAAMGRAMGISGQRGRNRGNVGRATPRAGAGISHYRDQPARRTTGDAMR